ncbi:MAG TPA: hypothetical protein ENL09_06130 [Bacteroidetes bacterium]|nr:hypothetical protein [Bacteroidota bacterium]
MTIHKNPAIKYNVIFGTIELKSPYLWPGPNPSKPLIDEMNITHLGRSETVKRALSDFGIDESFAISRRKFKEHYNFEIGISTADRTTKEMLWKHRHILKINYRMSVWKALHAKKKS